MSAKPEGGCVFHLEPKTNKWRQGPTQRIYDHLSRASGEQSCLIVSSSSTRVNAAVKRLSHILTLSPLARSRHAARPASRAGRRPPLPPPPRRHGHGSQLHLRCAAGTTCNSAIGYRVPNATTYGALLARFNTTTLAGLLGANRLPLATSPKRRVAAMATVVIPFTCLCAGNGVGQSNHAPVYTVQPQDGLDAIARNSFDAVVTYQEIATANKIADVDLIKVGQKLWIPLPCSCDPVGGADVFHLAHIVNGGETTSGIAATFGVTEDTLLKLNNIADPKSLKKDQVLDVPLPVCSSSISNNSADHNLRLPNGTYALTAQDCIQCSCSSNTFQLDCTLQGKKGCPAVPPCNGGLKLGDTSGAGCDSTMCAYSGYSNGSSFSIQTTLFKNQTAPACEKGGSSRSVFAGSVWRISAISFHMVLILVLTPTLDFTAMASSDDATSIRVDPEVKEKHTKDRKALSHKDRKSPVCKESQSPA
ncbi:hypothetical protein ZWY2020_035156 [Hordeum vulgare]|nr:hypothetical protein ZWY2020_035156 [Hordeum vulgare]